LNAEADETHTLAQAYGLGAICTAGAGAIYEVDVHDANHDMDFEHYS